MKHGKKSKMMMAGGRAGVKKMMGGGRAGMKKAAKSIGPGSKSVLSEKLAERELRKMIGKAGKTISNKDKEIVAKKMGGRAGVVKMMNGGDPLSKRGVKMGMSMSPSKNKGKGLYGK